ncbi:MAG: nitroreductase family protein [Candidatus Aminicenantes bacterium]|nr:nitroreductase family protein [Candidatus Aminicenantes bacterium]
MNFEEVVAGRRTVREFLARPIEEGKVRRVLEAGLAAPSNAHLKSWEFILLRDRESRRTAVVDHLKARNLADREETDRFLAAFEDEALKSVYRRSLPLQLTMMLEAPEVLIVVYTAKPLVDCRRLFDLNPLASAWMCIENIMLAMAAEGLFGCTYTPYDAAGLKKHLGIPEGREIAAVIPFGYPAKMPDAWPAEALEPRLHVDRW